MTQAERCAWLIAALQAEGGPPVAETEPGRLLRGLMNVRPPWPVDKAFLSVQDAFLQEERSKKKITDGTALPAVPLDPRLSLWRGDITTLRADAIVNAANSALLGCFHPCHGCIDNVIHSAAGIQLRLACAKLMEEQGCAEPPGRVKRTPGFHLPARYVLHTVGPTVNGPLTGEHQALLAGCYRSCLEEADRAELKSVAFCGVSTGVYHFPNQAAAEIAVHTVLDTLERCTSVQKVIFNVFTEADEAIYRSILS